MFMFGVCLTQDRYCHILYLGGVSWIVGGILGLSGLCCGWLTFFTFWIASSLVYVFLASQKVSHEGKAVLITGCDTGFGYAAALHLDSLGFRVFAACLFADKNGEGAESLRKHDSEKLHVIQMDVTSDTEITSARKEVEKLLPKGECLWGIINNAGIADQGYLELVSLPRFKRVSDVNIFGMINVIKTFLPFVRKSKGRIVNVASGFGRVGVPRVSPYVASKWAVEGMSDCLRLEMKPFGVTVVIIEPGNFIPGTRIYNDENDQKSEDERWNLIPDDVKDDYREIYQSSLKFMNSARQSGASDVTPVIHSMEEALLQRYPQARYQPMNWESKVKSLMVAHLPEWVSDWLYFALGSQ